MRTHVHECIEIHQQTNIVSPSHEHHLTAFNTFYILSKTLIEPSKEMVEIFKTVGNANRANRCTLVRFNILSEIIIWPMWGCIHWKNSKSNTKCEWQLWLQKSLSVIFFTKLGSAVKFYHTFLLNRHAKKFDYDEGISVGRDYHCFVYVELKAHNISVLIFMVPYRSSKIIIFQKVFWIF